jgi:pterin-4a-carbinolamine dehydratase
MKTPLAFISYRRADSAAWALLLAETLQRLFGLQAIFIDVDSIRVGDEWKKRIDDALELSTVVLPVIGPQWLFLQDEAGRRRIDLPSDWVRREIEYGLSEAEKVIPILVSGAGIPEREALPNNIVGLVDRQFLRWTEKQDVQEIARQLVEYGRFERLDRELDYPTRVDRSPALSQAELDEALRELPGWLPAKRPSEHATQGISEELTKTFKFRNFGDVIHFMATASRFIGMTDHHPNWENQYQDLRVRLTTWDIGHRISYKDVRLAKHLERLSIEYEV